MSLLGFIIIFLTEDYNNETYEICGIITRLITEFCVRFLGATKLQKFPLGTEFYKIYSHPLSLVINGGKF